MDILLFIIGLIVGFVACYLLNFAFARSYQKRLYELELVRSVEVMQTAYLDHLTAYESVRFNYERARNVLTMLKELYYNNMSITEREWEQVYNVVESLPEWESPNAADFGVTLIGQGYEQ